MSYRIFSASGGDLITETSFYHFLANKELPVPAYKIFTPFLLVLLGFDAADRNYYQIMNKEIFRYCSDF